MTEYKLVVVGGKRTNRLCAHVTNAMEHRIHLLQKEEPWSFYRKSQNIPFMGDVWLHI